MAAGGLSSCAQVTGMRPLPGARRAVPTDRDRCRRVTHRARAARGCLLPLSFGEPAAAALSTGHWTVRWLSDCCAYRTGPSAEIELGTVETQRGARVRDCSPKLRTHRTDPLQSFGALQVPTLQDGRSIKTGWARSDGFGGEKPEVLLEHLARFLARASPTI